MKFGVIDTGLGIKAEDQSKLFTLFGMIKQSQNSLNQNGCGIGLTVSQKYVELLGGKIKLKSKYEIGTDVTFSIQINEPYDLINSIESSLQINSEHLYGVDSTRNIAEFCRVYKPSKSFRTLPYF